MHGAAKLAGPSFPLGSSDFRRCWKISRTVLSAELLTVSKNFRPRHPCLNSRGPTVAPIRPHLKFRQFHGVVNFATPSFPRCRKISGTVILAEIRGIQRSRRIGTTVETPPILTHTASREKPRTWRSLWICTYQGTPTFPKPRGFGSDLSAGFEVDVWLLPVDTEYPRAPCPARTRS